LTSTLNFFTSSLFEKFQGAEMARWVGIALLNVMIMSIHPAGAAARLAEVDLDLHDLMSSKSTNPIEIWRKMRPQDFIGAPTVWELIV
jgi:hypothetical protein